MNKLTNQDAEIQRECVHAVEGEQVWVILNHVKPDRRVEFERFMHEIIAPIAERSEPDVLNQTRILHPAGPNEDGTYTYVILWDPVVPDGEYNLYKLLLLAYTPEESDDLIKLFSESLASDQLGYEVTQTAW